MPPLVYLASPYSSPSPEVRESRFHAACRAAAQLMAGGAFVFSPIAHTHPIALAGDLPKGWDWWREYDRRMLAACDEVAVLCIDGWRESVGVQGEIAIAAETGKPVKYLEAL
jgi:nucleoside 2-deoxyribosyltransferase